MARERTYMKYAKLTDQGKAEMDAICNEYRSLTCANTEGMDNFRNGYLAGMQTREHVEWRLRELIDAFQVMHNIHSMALAAMSKIMSDTVEAGLGFMEELRTFSDVCSFQTASASSAFTEEREQKPQSKDIN